MAFVHELSCECAKSELDLFSVPPTQTSIQSANYVEYNPISTITEGTPIEFVVGASGEDYIDLSSTQLFVRAQILTGDNKKITKTSKVGPINNFIHSLFAEVDVRLNGTLISSTNNTYAYRAYLETLLSYGRDAKKSFLTAGLYYKDTAGAMDMNDVTKKEGEENEGLISRHSFFQDGDTVDLMGFIHSDMFFQDKYLPSDVGLRIRLVRNKDSFCLMSDADTADFKVKIRDCKLFVRKAKLTPSVFLAHAQALEKTTAKYPIKRVVCKTYTIPAGNLSSTQENLFSGQLPSRIILGIVDNDAFNGCYTKNPFNFKHFDVSQISIYLDGQLSSIKPLELNYEANQYITGYLSLFQGTNKYKKDSGNDINRDEYGEGYSLYAYDLTPDMNDDNYFNLVREGSVRVDLKFRKPLPNVVNVIALAESENMLQIDKFRNITHDYVT